MNAAEPLTRRRAFMVTLPMVFANAVVPLAGVVDTAVVGAVGDKSALGGVALGTTIFDVVYFTLYFLRMSATGLTAQAHGRGDDAEVQRTLFRSLALGLALGLLVVAIWPLLLAGGLVVLEGTPDVDAAARAYFAARILGTPASLLLLGMGGWLIALGRSREVLVIHATFSGLNILLDVGFAVGLGWGLAGVGAATAIGEYVGAGVGLLYLRREIASQGGWRPGIRTLDTLFDGAALRQLLAVNVDFVIRSWSLLATFALFINSGARQGTAVLAGNHVLLRFVTLWAFVLDAWAYTAEAEVGRSVGSGSVERMRRAIRVTSEMALVSGVVFMLLTFAVGPAVLDAIVADGEVRAAAKRFLPYCAVIPFLGSAVWQLDGVFVGATGSRPLRNSGLVALVLYAAVDYPLSRALGAHGTWLALLSFYVARGGVLAAAYPALERSVARRTG